ncbi:MAG: PTS sugar transporter subunit IIA [Peptostreptococcaceae bacterium]
MTKREIQILKLICGSSSVITGKIISQEINCSIKTVQQDIKNINNRLIELNFKDSQIISIKSAGYTFVGNVDIINHFNNQDDYRIKFIIKKFFEKEIVKLEDLSELMYVSLSTTKSDLVKVKQILSDKNIILEIKHKKGLIVQNNEYEIINCIIYLINTKNFSIYDFIDKSNEFEFFKYRNILLSIIKKENMFLADFEFNSLFDYIKVYLSRNEVYNLSKFIKNTLKYYNFERNEIENDNTLDQNISNIIDEFILELEISTNISLKNDDIFKSFLLNHIKNIYKRIKLNVYTEEEFVDINLKYPYAYELSKIILSKIEKVLLINIDKKELSTIAIHIASAMDRASNIELNRKFKVIIICSSGSGTSMLIKSKIKDEFRDNIEVLRIMPSYLINYIDSNSVDFLISTVDVKNSNIDIIRVSPIVNQTDIIKIRNYMKVQKIDKNINLEDIFDKDLFFKNECNLENKFDIIEFLVQKLVDEGILLHSEKDKYIEREKIGTTEIGNFISIPHALISKNTNKIATLILKDETNWEIGTVKIVFMIAIGFNDDYEEIFRKLYKNIDNNIKVSNIYKSKNYEEFIKNFKG